MRNVQCASPQQLDLARLVLMSARHKVFACLLDGLSQGEPVVALTGPPGIGKPLIVATLIEELETRSLPVHRLSRGGSAANDLRRLAVQCLGKQGIDPQAPDDARTADVAQTERPPGNRLVILIEDAERLQTEAVRYVRLLARASSDRTPQFVLVGDTELWSGANPALAELAPVTGTQLELPALSPKEIRAFAGRLLSASSGWHRPLFEPASLELVVEQSQAFIGRLVALVEEIAAVTRERDLRHVTPAVVEAAVERLDTVSVMPESTAMVFARPAAARRPASQDLQVALSGPAVSASLLPTWAGMLGLTASARGQMMLMAGVAAAVTAVLLGAAPFRQVLPVGQSVSAQASVSEGHAAAAAGGHTPTIVDLAGSALALHSDSEPPLFSPEITAPSADPPGTTTGPAPEQAGTNPAETPRKPARTSVAQTHGGVRIFYSNANKGVWLFPPLEGGGG